MKFIHLSDLHIGLRLHEVSLLEDQKYILAQILDIVDEESADAVILAGDIYDKTVPPAEAVQVFDDFLVALARRKLQVFIISGNHDSPERIAFGGRLMGGAGVHVSPVYTGRVDPIILEDKWGEVAVYLLPFVKPTHVRLQFPEETIESYTDALSVAIGHMDLDLDRRNVLVTHQFVTGAERCESERVVVGGTDNVDVSAFDGFDYVALGHIHSPQNVAETIRYCGTPLKYSFSEANQQKSVTVVTLEEKGNVAVSLRPLTPRRDLVELRGTYEELMKKSFYEGTSLQEDYVSIVLTDEMPVPDAGRKLQVVYRNRMRTVYDNKTTRAAAMAVPEDVEQKTDFQLAEEHFAAVTGREMSPEQQAFLSSILVEEVAK